MSPAHLDEKATPSLRFLYATHHTSNTCILRPLSRVGRFGGKDSGSRCRRMAVYKVWSAGFSGTRGGRGVGKQSEHIRDAVIFEVELKD
ncbi:hypothetical protein Pmani_024715 [Petrolisthes manimaculis]|uniref:Uncharacterized protein n=1 Tax=Petrolisthes manimaculis TaxID=1843537 RepID=A0AAE1P8N3_9EUCA|nr:hypothetical protein Pmani_024715 [Petrolisthes manimaculis]